FHTALHLHARRNRIHPSKREQAHPEHQVDGDNEHRQRQQNSFSELQRTTFLPGFSAWRSPFHRISPSTSPGSVTSADPLRLSSATPISPLGCGMVPESCSSLPR